MDCFNELVKSGHHVKRVDPFLKKEVTDFIDTMMKLKMVFLDISISEWFKVIEHLQDKPLGLCLICAEDFSVYENIKEYLHSRSTPLPAVRQPPQLLRVSTNRVDTAPLL